MTAQTQFAAEEKKYFNLYLHGVGYLNNVRTLTRNKQSYLKVSVAVIQGPVDNADYLYIDCTVVGTEAKQLISHCAQEINSGRTVLACFTLSDLLVSPFIHQKSELRGQPGAGLTSNFLSLSMIKVDGEVAYTVPPKEQASDAGPAEGTGTSNTLKTVETPENTDASENNGEGDSTSTMEHVTVAHHTA